MLVVALLFLYLLQAARASMDLVHLPTSTSLGGRCMDGSPAGYFIRRGRDPSLFVINLMGGGYCRSQEDCDRRSRSHHGSSQDWPASMEGKNFLNENCNQNPNFCEATAVYVPYCTSDTHRGNRTEPSQVSWGYYMDGHANFIAIIENLINRNRLGAAENVLLTGTSAGGIGALFNVDWLAQRLPNAQVKAVSVAGWYLPAALPNDRPSIFPPSDYIHFVAGEAGNDNYDAIEDGQTFVDPWQMQGVLPNDCVAEYGAQWWACASIHQAYRYIQSPIFMVHSQYDSNQIYSGGMATVNPDESEVESVQRYIEMWGNATRTSLQLLLNNDVLKEKPHPDGVFAASCLVHGTPNDVSIDGRIWMEVAGDWFFQKVQKAEHYRLVETCPATDALELPCNAHGQCRFQLDEDDGSEAQTGPWMQCARQLSDQGCLVPFEDRQTCLECASLANQHDLKSAGCMPLIIWDVCGINERWGCQNEEVDLCSEEDSGGNEDDGSLMNDSEDSQQQLSGEQRQCVEQLAHQHCLVSFQNRRTCVACTRDRADRDELSSAGCTQMMISRICQYVEKSGCETVEFGNFCNDSENSLVEEHLYARSSSHYCKLSWILITLLPWVSHLAEWVLESLATN